MTEVRACKKCGEEFPLIKDNFGHMPRGGFRWTCRECIRRNVAAHTTKNPEMAADRYNKRRSQKSMSNNGYDSSLLRRKLNHHQNETCFYCKEKISGLGELDHMQPIIKGGLDIPDNIVLACSKCNKEKHNKSIDEYRDWLKKNGYLVRF